MATNSGWLFISVLFEDILKIVPSRGPGISAYSRISFSAKLFLSQRCVALPVEGQRRGQKFEVNTPRPECDFAVHGTEHLINFIIKSTCFTDF